MRIEYEQSNVTMDATIKLTGITEEFYRDIVMFISLRSDAYQKEPEAKVETPVEVEPEPQKIAPEAMKNSDSIDAKTDILRALLADFKAHPNKYDTVEMTSSDYLALHPEYDGISAKTIGKIMGAADMGKRRVNRRAPSGTWGTYWVFSFPVQKVTLGDKLQRARQDNNLTIEEVAELIGYPKDIVRRWETDEYTPSSAGIEKLKQVFGSDVFDGLSA